MIVTNFDDVFRHVGDFGRYQKFVYGLVCAVAVYVGVFNLGVVFTTYIPKHRCRLPHWNVDTYSLQSENHSAAINATIPVVYDNRSHETEWSKCSVYTDNGTLVACTQWVYDTSIFTSTIVSQFNLVCQWKTWRIYVRMTYMAGQMCGALVFGPLSDKIGRRLCVMIGLFVLALSGSVMAASPNVFAFMAFNFLAGVGSNSCYMIAFGLGMEFVAKSKRFHTGIIINYFYAIGVMIEALFSFMLRDWKHLQLLSTLPGIIFVSYFWLLPESPRWLINQNRHTEAWAIIERMAKANKADVKEMLLQGVETEPSQPKATVKIWQLFRHKSLIALYAIIFLNWITCSLLYYGLSLNSGDLVGSIHLNVFLTGLMEVVGYFLCHVLVNKIGRKLLFIISIMSSGIACLLTIFPLLYLSNANQWLTVVLAMLGKLGVTCAFAIVYIHTAEIFPTVIRTTSLGAASMVARVGSIISPYIADMGLLLGGSIGRVLPLMIFGSVAVTSGIASLYLPETLNKPLPETFDDCKKLKRKPEKNLTIGNRAEENVPLANKRTI